METRHENGIGFVCRAGQLEPDEATVVFVHGAGSTQRVWHDPIAGLAEQVNFVALDLPGRGLSGGEGLRSIADYARVVGNFVEAIGSPRPVVCGHSMGGAIALKLLLDRADLFSGAILVATGARLRVSPAILEGIRVDYAAHLANLALSISPRTDPAALQPVFDANASCAAEVALGDFEACNAFDVSTRLGEIEVPVLIVSGDDDPMTPPKYSDFMQREISGAQRVSIADAGHWIPAERPDELTRAIAHFLPTTDL
jgi:pimeloyl-ACP methyl ester carboxylesterase